MATLVHLDTLRQHAVPPAVLASLVLAHDIPGRLRVVLPHLRDDAPTATALRGTLLAVDRVTDVRVNYVTGSVTVLYGGGEATRVRVLATLDCQGDCQGQRRGGVARGDAVVDILLKVVAKHLAEAAAHALLAALI